MCEHLRLIHSVKSCISDPDAWGPGRRDGGWDACKNLPDAVSGALSALRRKKLKLKDELLRLDPLPTFTKVERGSMGILAKAFQEVLGILQLLSSGF